MELLIDGFENAKNNIKQNVVGKTDICQYLTNNISDIRLISLDHVTGVIFVIIGNPLDVVILLDKIWAASLEKVHFLQSKHTFR